MSPEVRRLHRILVVEPQPAALRLLRSHLKMEGFEVLEAVNGEEALEIAAEERPALIIMDLALPEPSGAEVYQRLKSNPATKTTAVLILSAKSDETDIIAALELGVDDYVTRPFAPREVALRVRAILRYQIHKALSADRLTVGDIEIHRSRYEVKVGGDLITLTPIEFRLLGLLGEHRGCVQTRRLLLDQLWGADSEFETRTVDSHIARLRGKLGPAGKQLVTIRGFGYRLDEEAEEEAELQTA